MKEINKYIEIGHDRFLSELMEFLEIPSISSQIERKGDVERCARWLANHIESIGISDVKIIETAGNPIVYGEWLGAGIEAPTVLLYGHYDVQPVDPLNLWHSDPFKPRISGGKLFGRGTADDKGQVFCHLKAIEAFFKTKGTLPVNLKLLIEGEEEAMASHIDEFVEQNAEMLYCDAIIISDTEWFDEGIPSICYGLRGISFAELTVYGPNRDLHSGSFGGAIDNPLNVLCKMIASLTDAYGRITIPGFYDDVLELTGSEREGFAQLPYNEKDYINGLGIKGVNGEYGFTTLERVWARPSLDLNGIWGGYTGEGSKTILPSKATAKISMRLVPNQNAQDIAKKIKQHLMNIAPPTLNVEVTSFPGGNPVLVEQNSPAVKAAIIAFKEAFGKDSVFMREGGSIPIVGLFDKVLNAPTVLMGLGLPTDNTHSPNENFDLNNFFGGIKASAVFFDELAKLHMI